MDKPKFLTIRVREAVRAVDVFLFHFTCPLCGCEQFSGPKPERCLDCDSDYQWAVLDVSSATYRNVAVQVGARARKQVSKKIVRYLFDLQHGQCAYCDHPLPTEYHVDHVLPVSAGGSNNPSNLALACPPCNLSASGKVFKDYYAKRDYVQWWRLNYKFTDNYTPAEAPSPVSRPDTLEPIKDQDLRAGIYRFLRRAFDNDEDRVLAWMATPNKHFNNVSPTEFAKRLNGLRYVYRHVAEVVSKHQLT